MKKLFLALFLSASVACMADNKSETFVYSSNVKWENAEPGVVRQVMSYNNDIMTVVVKFKKGAVGAMHSHPHSQSTYVADGVFDVTIDGKTQRLSKGDCFMVNPNLKHGVKCLKRGSLIDTFNPMRRTFIGLEE